MIEAIKIALCAITVTALMLALAWLAMHVDPMIQGMGIR